MEVKEGVRSVYIILFQSVLFQKCACHGQLGGCRRPSSGIRCCWSHIYHPTIRPLLRKLVLPPRSHSEAVFADRLHLVPVGFHRAVGSAWDRPSGSPTSPEPVLENMGLANAVPWCRHCHLFPFTGETAVLCWLASNAVFPWSVAKRCVVDSGCANIFSVMLLRQLAWSFQLHPLGRDRGKFRWAAMCDLYKEIIEQYIKSVN